MYPIVSQKILKFYQEIYSGDLPEGFNVSQLDPSPRIELIEKISLKLLKKV